MRDIAFIILFLAMLPAALRFGHVATMTWAWVATIAPSQYMFGMAAGLPFNKIVVAVAFIALIVDSKHRHKFYADGHVLLLVAFLLVATISYAAALSDRMRVDELMDRLSKAVLLCGFVILTIRTRLEIHSLLIAIAMGMGIHGAIEAAKFISSGGGHVLQGPATIGDNNHFGLAILMVIPPLAYLYVYSEALIVRAAMAVATLANVVAVIASNSRGALLGLIAVGFVMFLNSRNKLGAIILLVVIGATAAALAPDRWYDRMSTIGSADSDSSFMNRVGSWKMNMLVALDRPLTGGGFSSMEDPGVFRQYLLQFSKLDFIPTDTPTIAFAAHSIYFQVLGDTGFIGFFLFVGLLFCAFRNVRIIQRLGRGREDVQWAVDLARFLRLTLIAFMVSGAALSLAYFEFYYIMITLLSVTRRHVQEVVSPALPAGSAVLGTARRPAFGGLAAGSAAALRRHQS